MAKAWSSISQAGEKIADFIEDRLYRAGGLSLSNVVYVTARLGLRPTPLFEGFDFKARLLELPESRYALAWNKAYPEQLQIRHMLHEIAEYLALEDFPALFDFTEDQSQIRFDGLYASHDLRHLVAREAENIICSRNSIAASPEKYFPPKIQPVPWARYRDPRIEIEYVPTVEYCQSDTFNWETQ